MKMFLSEEEDNQIFELISKMIANYEVSAFLKSEPLQEIQEILEVYDNPYLESYVIYDEVNDVKLLLLFDDYYDNDCMIFTLNSDQMNKMHYMRGSYAKKREWTEIVTGYRLKRDEGIDFDIRPYKPFLRELFGEEDE